MTAPSGLRRLALFCAWCDAEMDWEWVWVGTYTDPGRTIPGRVTCPTPGCGPRCPTCRREPGDIHGPECGEIIAGKLGDLRPCTITEADCGERMAR